MRLALSSLTLVLLLSVVPAATAERIVGNARDNRLIGTEARDTILGLAGNDVLSGRGGRDTIDGGEGDDVVVGGRGADSLTGAGRDDTVDGGARGDVISAGFGPDVVSGGGGNDVIVADETDERLDTVDCGPGRDRAFIRRGDRAFDCERVVRRRGPRPDGVLWNGGPGADVKILRHESLQQRNLMAGLGGNDVLDAFAGNDLIWGNWGNDALYGQTGGDWLIGGGGDDRLFGGRGLDRLWAGPGRDVLDGNAEDESNTDDDRQPDLLFLVEDDGVDTAVCGVGDRVVARNNDIVVHRLLCARVVRLPRG